MGFPKALLNYRGRTFLQSILDVTLALGVKRFVALGHDADKVLAKHDLRDVSVVMNDDLDAGPIGSIRASIRAVESQPIEALIVWPVDFPHVRVDTIQALMNRFEKGDEPEIVVPECEDKGGHPVIFRRTVFDELLSAPDSVGARTVVRRDASRVARVLVTDHAVIDSVNTPESYKDLLR
jgi:molybdenum cofactor cytidylyltransferase